MWPDLKRLYRVKNTDCLAQYKDRKSLSREDARSIGIHQIHYSTVEKTINSAVTKHSGTLDEGINELALTL